MTTLSCTPQSYNGSIENAKGGACSPRAVVVARNASRSTTETQRHRGRTRTEPGDAALWWILEAFEQPPRSEAGAVGAFFLAELVDALQQRVGDALVGRQA